MQYSTCFLVVVGSLAIFGCSSDPPDLAGATPQTAVQAATNAGLVGHWRFDDTGGMTLKDSTPNGNDAVLAGPFDRIAHEPFRRAIDFRGGHAAVPRSPSIDSIRGGVTIAGWVRATGAPNGWASVLSRQLGSDWREHYGLYILGPERRPAFATSSGRTLVAPRGIAPGEWVHLTGTFDDVTDTVKLYVNCAEVASGTVPGELSGGANPVVLGGNINGGDADRSRRRVEELFPGALDEVRLYGRVLSGGEVDSLCAPCEEGERLCGNRCVPSGGCCSDAECAPTSEGAPQRCNAAAVCVPKGDELVGHWRFDESEGAVALDRSPNENHGTLAGTYSRLDHEGWGRAVALEAGHASVPRSSSIDEIRGGVTISGWVRASGAKTGWGTVLSRQLDSDWREHYGLYIHGPDRRPAFATSSGSTLMAARGIPANEWVHLTGTFDDASDTVRLYVNCAEVLTGVVPGELSSGPNGVVIGGNVNGGDADRGRRRVEELFPGALDDVRLYGRVLSEEEVGRLCAPCGEGERSCGGRCIPADGCCGDSECAAENGYVRRCGGGGRCEVVRCGQLVGGGECGGNTSCDFVRYPPEAVLACREVATEGAQGAVCTSRTTCSRGFMCLGAPAGYQCERFCSDDAQCVGTGSRCDDGGIGPTCSTPCTPVSNVGCASGFTCHPLSRASDNAYLVNCLAQTGGRQGTPCEFVNDCAPGYTCPTYADGSARTCTKICDVSAQTGCEDLPAHVCQSFSTPFVLSGIEYGTCRPTTPSLQAISSRKNAVVHPDPVARPVSPGTRRAEGSSPP